MMQPDTNKLLNDIRLHLDHGIVPFWAERAEDKTHGGFLTNFDSSGKPLDTPEKYVNTQSRLIWWFSRLNRFHPDPAWVRLAQQGVDFLIEHFWDKTQEGFFWKCRRDGTPLDDGKIVYGQSFAIYALSEYTLATGDPRGLLYAERTFDALQRFCADTRHGGYREYLNADWSPESFGFAGGDRKTLDAHMHLMEAFTVLFEASGRAIHGRKLMEVLDLIAHRMIDSETGCGLNQFNLDWTPVPALALKRTWNAERFGEQPAQPVETTSYGHNIELAWLMRRALTVAGVDPAPYAVPIRRLLDHARKFGLDPEYGGLYRDGLKASGKPVIVEKEFWQHAESLVGFLDGYEAFGDTCFLDAFANLWQFVRDHMINADVGEWRTLVSREGESLDAAIGNPWKVSYHTGRAMIECVERLERLQQSAKGI